MRSSVSTCCSTRCLVGLEIAAGARLERRERVDRVARRRRGCARSCGVIGFISLPSDIMPLCCSPSTSCRKSAAWREGRVSVMASSPGSRRAAARMRLGLLPQRVHLLERGVDRRRAALGQPALDVVEAVAEAMRRRAQLALGIDAEVAREVDDREQQVADLARQLAASVSPRRAPLLDLAQLLAHLGERAARRRASRTRPRRPSPGAGRRRPAPAGPSAARRAASRRRPSPRCLISCHWR